jgi:hypothetical protein
MAAPESVALGQQEGCGADQEGTMADMIHGRPSAMQAYRPEGPNQVEATGPAQGMMASASNFTPQDQTGEGNLVQYMTEAKQGVRKYGSTVNGTGGEYLTTDIFNGVQFDRVDGTEA